MMPHLRKIPVSLEAALPVLSTLLALLFGALLILATARQPALAAAAFLDGAFGSAYAIGASLNRAVTLALVGIGFVLANRANLTNVGGEGQLALGGMTATALALHGGGVALFFPATFLWPLLGGAVAGAAWGALAGILRVRFGTNEVISTLLLSFVAIWIVYAATHSTRLLRQPQTSSTSLPESLDIPTITQIPTIGGSSGSPLHLGIVFALIAALCVHFVLARTAWGLRLKAVGVNERAARRAGVRPGRMMVLALLCAGALGGMAGAIMIQGEQFNLKSGFTSGYGFDGLAVGLLARGSSLVVLGYALFFGFLRSGGISMEIAAGVPSAVVQVIQGLIVVSVAASTFIIDYSKQRS